MGPNQGRKARVIAKIKGSTDLEPDSTGEASRKWISVHKPNGDESESVTVSFGDQSASAKESYELDFCYDQHEGNALIFSREVKPLIKDVFDGRNATIMASGARGSGKTFLIQGSEEEPGLAVLAMTEILSMAKESGKLITVSCYEISKDHAYDILDPQRREILVLEDIARGKIQLKRLSQVAVNSIQEFQKLYLSSKSSLKQILTEPYHRCHRGLIVYIFDTLKADALPLGKMNFVDLAGYEDSRRKSADAVNLLENNKINMSMYAIHNVIYALNANESHVPFRGSKLTRMLRDSLGGKNKILMVTCLNSSFCQDSLYMTSLASRSWRGSNKIIPDSTKKTKSVVRPTIPSSHKSASATVTKQTGPRVRFPVNKASVTVSAIKGRKLFDDACRSTKSKKVSQKESLSLEIVSTSEQTIHEEESSALQVVCVEETAMPDNAFRRDETNILDKVVVPNEDSHIGTTPNIKSNAEALSSVGADHTVDKENNLLFVNKDDSPPISACLKSNAEALSSVGAEHTVDKENNLLFVNKDDSPPISARLQELSKTMKLLYSSTPSCIEVPPKPSVSFDGQVSTENLEPKTPEPGLSANDKLEIANADTSPWKAFSARSFRMKSSLVDEYIKFLNTANKEDLKKLKGIGEKRATYILELRQETPEPFKNLDDLKEIGLSAKQIKGMVRKQMGGLFN